MRTSLSFIIALFFVAVSSTNGRAQTIYSTSLVADTTCGELDVTMMTSTGCIPGLTATINYGDGTTATSAVTCYSGTGYAWFANYHYTASGTHTVKVVLYSGSSPIDSSITSHTVQFCHDMPLFAYNDVNMNCIQDAGETSIHVGLPIEVDSAGVHIDTVSMASGMWYRAYGPSGTIYRFRPLIAPTSMAISCPSVGYIEDTIPSLLTDTIARKYFGYYCSSSSVFDLGMSASFTPAITGGAANRACLMVDNISCVSTAATIRFDFSPKYTFGSIIPASTSYTVTGTSVLIDAGMVSNFATSGGIYVKLIPITTLVMGDTVNSMFTVFPIAGDANATNNVVVRCDTIRASYDPNQKSVSPTGNINPGTKLEYMLEFENTGNDTAYNVHVMDTLSDYLDLNTFEVGASTHSVNVILFADAGNNIVKFDFPNIKLWDSSHHDMNKGMVTFTINAKTTLSLGTTIPNRVGIYFDSNPVVMTNTVLSHIPLPTGVSNMKLTVVELYPNPVKDQLHIKADNGDYTMLTIYNVVGQSVRTQDVTGSATTVNVGSLVPGIYYVTLKGQAGSKTIKFEKQ